MKWSLSLSFMPNLRLHLEEEGEDQVEATERALKRIPVKEAKEKAGPRAMLAVLARPKLTPEAPHK